VGTGNWELTFSKCPADSAVVHSNAHVAIPPRQKAFLIGTMGVATLAQNRSYTKIDK